jgi:hypothetical protein
MSDIEKKLKRMRDGGYSSAAPTFSPEEERRRRIENLRNIISTTTTSSTKLICEKPRPVKAPPVAEMISGRTEQVGDLEIFIAGDSYDINHVQGQVRIGDAFDSDYSKLAHYMRDASLVGFNAQKALYIDTETTGLAGGQEQWHSWLVPGTGAMENLRWISIFFAGWRKNRRCWIIWPNWLKIISISCLSTEKASIFRFLTPLCDESPSFPFYRKRASRLIHPFAAFSGEGWRTVHWAIWNAACLVLSVTMTCLDSKFPVCTFAFCAESGRSHGAGVFSQP